MARFVRGGLRVKTLIFGNPAPGNGKGAAHLSAGLREKSLPGYVVHPGNMFLPLGQGVTALPLSYYKTIMLLGGKLAQQHKGAAVVLFDESAYSAEDVASDALDVLAVIEGGPAATITLRMSPLEAGAQGIELICRADVDRFYLILCSSSENQDPHPGIVDLLRARLPAGG